MKNNKWNETPATFANSATQKAGLTSLLDGSIDPNDSLALMGLGVGATRRAKDLVLKGLEVERQEELTVLIENELAKLAAEENCHKLKSGNFDKLRTFDKRHKGQPVYRVAYSRPRVSRSLYWFCRMVIPAISQDD